MCARMKGSLKYALIILRHVDTKGKQALGEVGTTGAAQS
jgi:hypothetical protein